MAILYDLRKLEIPNPVVLRSTDSYCRISKLHKCTYGSLKKHIVSLFILYNCCFKTYVFKENKVQFRKK
jgi:Flp pilus assembly protein protease CpaA